jgi:hypothetical protein
MPWEEIMKQMAVVVGLALATWAIFALIITIGAAPAGHRNGRAAFVVMGNGAAHTAVASLASKSSH